mgnify:CR=1|jgi:hypothetical protein
MKCRNLNEVLDARKGRFVSVLLKNGMKRELYSAKVHDFNSMVVRFKDTNGGERRVSRSSIIRAKVAKRFFKRSRD